MNAREKLTDFNDLAKKRGKAAVAAMVANAMPPEVAESIEDWPDPILPGGVRVPLIEADLLPGWMGAMAKAVADSTQTPEAMATMMTLAILATCLQRQYVVQPYADDPGYVEPLVLWVIIALVSGTRKTAVIDALLTPVKSWEQRQRDLLRREMARISAARAVAKKRIEKLVRDASSETDADRLKEIREEIERTELDMPAEIHAPRLFTGDVTAERLQTLLVEQGERMAVITDEAGIFTIMAGLYSGGIANIDVFLQAHAGSAVRVDRADREAYLSNPALSFGLALQPGILADVAKNPRFRASGLLARFLFTLPESNVGKRDVRKRMPIPAAVKLAWSEGIATLLEGRRLVPDDPVPLAFTADALECWIEFLEEIEGKIGVHGELEPISDWASKLPGAVARMAGLIQLASDMGTSRAIGADAVTRAITLGQLLIPHAQAAFDLLGADQVDADAMAILKWARDTGTVTTTRRTVQKAMEGRFRTLERLNKAAERLRDRDVLRERKEQAKRGAPPSVWYSFNPKALSA